MVVDFNKVDGETQAAESLVGDLDFFTLTITSAQTIATGGEPGVDDLGVPLDLEQFLLDKMVEVISQKAQPVLLALGSNKILNVAVEHTALWTENALQTDPKAESLDAALTAVVLAVADEAGNVQYPGFAVTIVFAATI